MWSRVICILVLIAFPITAADENPVTREVLEMSSVTAGMAAWVEPNQVDPLIGFARAGKFLTHAIVAEEKTAIQYRKAVSEAGISGIASVEALPLKVLPYSDNMVNLLVAENLPALLSKAFSFREVLRVLAPEGVACLGLPSEQRNALQTQLTNEGIRDFRFVEKNKLWLVIKKPRPAGLDDWTHWNHGPDNNPVSHDTALERPNQLQWIAGEHWENRRGVWSPGAGSPNGMRSANGRNYYIMGGVVARDAFNGVMLWYESIKGLESHFVVASGDEVYVKRGNELVALSGATGKQVRSYGEIDGFSNMLLADEKLVVLEKKGARAFDAASGQEKWVNPDAAGGSVPVESGGKVFYTKGAVYCLDLNSGKQLWKAENPDKSQIQFAFGDKLLMCAHELQYTALSVADGSVAWNYAAQAKGRAYFAGGLLWLEAPDDRSARNTEGFHNAKGGEAHKWIGLDPASGEVRRTLQAPVALDFRCHPVYATDRFMIANRPLYFTDWQNASVTRFEGTRMACGSSCGLAQGMFFGLYTRSNLCMCVRQAISGISAFTSDHRTIDGVVTIETETQLQAGPAQAPNNAHTATDDWPMYRCDFHRSSTGASRIPHDLALSWKTELAPHANEALSKSVLLNDWALNKVSGDAITQPVSAEGKVFVALTHAQQVVALDAGTGQVIWKFLCPSRMDAPPTIHDGVCLFGCHDGCVYAVRSDNGELIWRFRAAPVERRIVAYGEVESVWPVIGGVLVVEDTAYVVAGRTTETDGGLYVYALNFKTGKPLWSERRVKPDDGQIGAWNLRGNSTTYFGPSDLLVSDGKYVAISGHSRGGFDCRTGQWPAGRSFDGPHFGWMQSRYSSDNQKEDYPPCVYAGKRFAYTQPSKVPKGHPVIALSGKPGWKIQATGEGNIVEALAAAGNTAAVGSQPTAPCPAMRIKSVTAPPVIDGTIDELYLQNAVPLKFSMLDGSQKQPKSPTTAWILCDKENLYVVVRCETDDPDKLVCKKTKRDEDVWQDECIELFIDPLNKRDKNYFHIIVNSAGITQDSRAGDLNWNPELTVKCGKAEKAWIAELKIPFAELGLKPGAVEHVWSINLNRSARSVSKPDYCEDTAWSRTFSESSHVPEMFGRIWLDSGEGGADDAAYAAWQKSVAPVEDGTKAANAAGQESGVVIAALSADKNGQVLLLSPADGSTIGTVDLPGAPAFEGLSVAHGRIYVSLQDGSVVCLAGK